jgi:hypothetical protein
MLNKLRYYRELFGWSFISYQNFLKQTQKDVLTNTKCFQQLSGVKKHRLLVLFVCKSKFKPSCHWWAWQQGQALGRRKSC